MKVLKIDYKTKQNELVRTIFFKKDGLSIVVGNAINNKNLKESTNGVGKTILMKTIDYIYGANSEKALSEKLSNYYFEATILVNDVEHIVTRYFEKNGKILLDNLPVSVDEYKTKLSIERNEVRKLLLLNSRNSISETPGTPYNVNDLTAIFKLLSLSGTSKIVVDIKSKCDELSGVRETKKKLLEIMEVSSSDIDIRLTKNKEELDQAKREQNDLKNKLKSLSVNEENDNIQREFEQDNFNIKKLRRENYSLGSEKTRLESYLITSSSFSLTSDEIKNIYEEAGLFLNQGVLTELKEVEDFYKKLIEDRSRQIAKRVKIIESTISENNAKISQLSQSLSVKSAILSKDDAYQNALILLSNVQTKLESLTLELGRLEQYSKLDKKESEIVVELTQLYINLNLEKDNISTSLDTFKKFVLKASERLYEDDEATFDADFKAYKEKGLPCSLSINFRKGQSGGVSLVKNVIFDYLLFKYDLKNEILMHDSICFSDIDTRQIATLLMIGDEIGKEKNKQYIVALNKDSIHESAYDLVKEKMVLELSEDDLLLKKEL